MSDPAHVDTEAELLALAQHGDRRAFDALLRPHVPRLENLLRRMVGDVHAADDLLQETLVRVCDRLGQFRGEAKLTTWLHTIATRIALDYLASRRLATNAQVRLRELAHAEHATELNGYLASGSFDARRHIAFCFACVARSLDPDEQAALVLRDVVGLDNREAAGVLGLTTSVLRHRLAHARTEMQAKYAGLCRLVSKTGVCYQCEGLRATFPEAVRGDPVPVLATPGDSPVAAYRRRVDVVREAEQQSSEPLPFHTFLWRVLGTTWEHKTPVGML